MTTNTESKTYQTRCYQVRFVGSHPHTPLLATHVAPLGPYEPTYSTKLNNYASLTSISNPTKLTGLLTHLPY
jgi:hypothetical protein